MRVPANTFDRLWAECAPDAMAAIARVGQSGWYILGREVDAFETALAGWSGRGHAVGVANGMDAIEIALRLHGIGAGDKVLTSPLSAFPTALAILRAGAVPVFADTDDQGLLSPEAVRMALATHPDIRAIVAVHLYGHLADMEAIAALASAQGIPVIEDAAQAIGAHRHGMGIGEGGRIATLSFYPTKNLGVIGDGGALLMDDAASAQTARALRNYGQTAKYVHDLEGLNSRLDELHAATLVDAFLPRLGGWLARRREIAQAYLEGIDTGAVRLMPGADPQGAGWHLFPVCVAPQRREDFMAHLQAAGIGAGIHYPILMSDQQALRARGEPLCCGDLETARRIAQSEVSLPIHPYLTSDEQDHVIATVNAWKG